MKFRSNLGIGARARRGSLIAAAVLFATAGIALAAKPVKNGHYAGTEAGRSTSTISFTVNASGKKVIDLDADTPFHCSGGCGGVGGAENGSAKISHRKGTFKAVIRILGPGLHPSVEGKDTITGKFTRGGGAKGTISSHFNHNGSIDETVHWTASS